MMEQDDASEASEEEGKSEWKTLELLRDPHLRAKTAFVCVVMLSVMVVTDTIAFDTQFLKGNFLLNWALLSLVIGPANLLNVLLLNKFGRIWPAAATFAIAGAFCFLAIPADSFLPALASLFTIVANFFIFTAEGLPTHVSHLRSDPWAWTGMAYQLATEEFPTVVRGSGVGLACAVGDVGVLAMPFIVYLNAVSFDVPMLIMGGLCVLGAAAVLALPETKGKALPQALHDGATGHKAPVSPSKTPLLRSFLPLEAGWAALKANFSVCCRWEGDAAEREPLLPPPALSPSPVHCPKPVPLGLPRISQ